MGQEADPAGQHLSAVQAAAIDHVRGLARRERDRALRRIGQVAAAPLIENVRRHGRVTLNFHPDGASPRFGSCYARLRPDVLDRCTCCFGDSHLGPDDVGTIDTFECVLAGMLEAAASTGGCLGVSGADPVDRLRRLPAEPVDVAPDAPQGRSLDDYIEAQVHGEVDLAVAAEALVLDPSFRGTEPGERVAATARRCGIRVEWHAGFQLAAAEVPAEFRGPAVPPLALRVCEEFAGRDGMLNAEVLGRAAADLHSDPDRWAEFGDYAAARQLVKQLWHVLVAFGGPHTG